MRAFLLIWLLGYTNAYETKTALHRRFERLIFFSLFVLQKESSELIGKRIVDDQVKVKLLKGFSVFECLKRTEIFLMH